MATVSSASITNLDAVPQVIPTSGQGSFGNLKHIGDYATTSANLVQTVALVRVPTTFILKAAYIEAAAQTQGTFNVGFYYGSGLDTPAAIRGTVVDADFLATSVDCSSAVARTDITNEGGFYAVNERNMPLWQALGLSSDPTGSFDLVLTSTNTVTTGGLVAAELMGVTG
jgi:hypothetical protein